jgi:hypothetical protein
MDFRYYAGQIVPQKGAGMRRYQRGIIGAIITVGLVFGFNQPAAADHHGAHVVVAPGAVAPRVGPSYLYPDPALTPGAVNPNISQANIDQTICNPQWSTKSIRPPVTYTNGLKAKQLAAARYTDKSASHYEEDHFISLELGGNPTDEKNLWPEPWGTPATPLTSRGPFPVSVVGAKSKDQVENALHKEVCAGTLTLQEAQHIISTDWFKYYRDTLLK